jgi:hypothetical protein
MKKSIMNTRKRRGTMKVKQMLLFLAVLGFVAMFPLALLAAEKAAPAPDKDKQQQAQPAAEIKKAATTPVPVYKPPQFGAPGGRVGGGTRGVGDESLVMAALVPNHVGLTTQEQPTLYWYLSKGATSPFEFAISEENSVNPLVAKRITTPERAGIYAVRLKDYGLQLKPDATYRWFVAMVPDPERRSKDIIAGGMIKRVAAPPEMQAKLSKADRNEALLLYGEQGIWYDLIMTVSEAIEDKPGDGDLRTFRSELLKQVGLSDVVAVP